MSGTVSRRSFIVGALGAAGLAACGGGGETPTASGPSLLLRPAFAAGDRFPAATVSGIPQRLTFVVSDTSTGQVTVYDDAPDTLEIEIVGPDGTATATAGAPRRVEGITTPYYPLEITAPGPGRYQARTTLAGEQLSAGFDVVDPSEVGLVQVGEPIRPVETPTFDDARGVDPICTRVGESCPFHEVTLTDAIAAPGPTALLVATPSFCLTDICGPVVDLLMDVSGEFAGFTFVHAEVYTDPQELFTDGVETEDLLTRTMMIYDLGFEPSLVVADATGTVTARLDFTFDRVEMREALASAT